MPGTILSPTLQSFVLIISTIIILIMAIISYFTAEYLNVN